MKDNFFGKKKIGFQLKERRKPSSRRSRAHPRTPQTHQNKIRKLKSRYNRLFNQSKKSKEDFDKFPQEKQKTILKSISQNRKEPKPFFYAKYPTFEDWLKVIKVKLVGRTKEKENSIFSSSSKESIWGR